ncbi:1-deoxy-D-xylulose-5-phosphate reductoisomerase [Candidatus Sororendozoicomonas aggregata]|uniref:1-deoxy-D-xylulose-5-phosphate reductoisomerase n=1 Tax=Candidatus Sororendozoicomonas aggregata TaxID=3073239 RepID=UPI002ED1FDEF
MQELCILGSTGSIGKNTLDVVARHPGRYRVRSLVAGKNDALMLAQISQFNPDQVVMADETAAKRLRLAVQAKGLRAEILWGTEHIVAVAEDPAVDTVMAAVVGAAGLLPTLAAVKAGKKVLLANKEVLVMTGELFMSAANAAGATLLPIDSEHNAIFQCMPPHFSKGLNTIGVRRVVLTASGGPFRETPLGKFAEITPAQACVHPNWSMGQKISIDSATMMNKGLEFIEACWLFDARPDQVDVVIHPQSIVHSMVDYVDGSVLAQLGNPDMRTPIAHGLAWPERIASGVTPLSLSTIACLDFYEPDMRRYHCLKLAMEAARAGGTAPAALNAANEQAVAAFLCHQLRFDHISRVVDEVLQALESQAAASVEHVLDADRQARCLAKQCIIKLKNDSMS